MSQLSHEVYNQGSGNVKYAFAEYPSIKIYKESEGSSWGNHLLFGDYIKILDTTIQNGRVKAKSRNTTGWVKIDQIRKNRILEVNFVDIGQGDGCHIVTPNDEHILIDAGKGTNMNRYLTWRFNLYNRSTPLSFPFSVIISHSDLDHYGGFDDIFENNKIKIDKVYHNGLVERPGDKVLGEIENGYITGLVQNTNEMLEIIDDSKNRKGKNSKYCSVLYKSFKQNPNIEYKSLSLQDAYLSPFDVNSIVQNVPFQFKILGPITKKTNGRDSLKSIEDLGKDKNGHSVILKLIFGNARILLGGDVNTEFGKIIHDHFDNTNALDELVVDVAKACHHGSNHFHYKFIEAINSAATVISSGDEESYSHPRPDAIGALGKCGYGNRPLIFSTELARSNKEFTASRLVEIGKLWQKLKDIEKVIIEETDAIKLEKLKKQKVKINKDINSHLTKYGMINLRTDGQRIIMAQKFEVQPSYGKWDIHKLEYSNNSGRFELID